MTHRKRAAFIAATVLGSLLTTGCEMSFHIGTGSDDTSRPVAPAVSPPDPAEPHNATKGSTR